MADEDNKAGSVCQEAAEVYCNSMKALADGPAAPAQYMCGYALEESTGWKVETARSGYLSREALVGMLGRLLATYAEDSISREEMKNFMDRIVQGRDSLIEGGAAWTGSKQI